MTRKLFVLLFALFSFAAVHAQEHLTFKGVPIDGTLGAFVAEMECAGFTYVDEKNDVVLMHGDFAGFKNCDISVSTLKSVDIVNSVSVTFDMHDRWSDLYNNYSTLKGMLVKKYGRYKVCVERFNSSYSPTSDGSRMTLLFLDKCKYYVIWETVNGTIKLDLVKGSSVTSGGKVRLQYWDKKNTEVVNEKALEDL